MQTGANRKYDGGSQQNLRGHESDHYYSGGHHWNDGNLQSQRRDFANDSSNCRSSNRNDGNPDIAEMRHRLRFLKTRMKGGDGASSMNKGKDVVNTIETPIIYRDVQTSYEREEAPQSCSRSHLSENRNSSDYASRKEQNLSSLRHPASNPSSGSLSGYSRDEEFPEEAFASGNLATMTCPTCSRHFTEDSLQKHMKVCEKVFKRRRKAFDMSKKRLQDLDADKKLTAMKVKQSVDLGSTFGGGMEKKSTWRGKSEQFRAAMKMARVTDPDEIAEQQAIFSKYQTASTEKNQCPHCNRTFARPETLEKHQNICKRMFSKTGGVLRKGEGISAYNGVGVVRNQAAAMKASSSGEFGTILRGNSQKDTFGKKSSASKDSGKSQYSKFR